MTNRLASRFAALALAAVAGLAGTAFAQPAHHGRDGGDLLMGIAALKSQLSLNTSQQTMWDNAVAASSAARDSVRTNMQKVHDAMATELAKAEPDLAAVAVVADASQASNQSLHRQVRAAWLNLYGTFTPDQKAVVKASLQKRMAKMEAMHEKMMQRHQQGG